MEDNDKRVYAFPLVNEKDTLQQSWECGNDEKSQEKIVFYTLESIYAFV